MVSPESSSSSSTLFKGLVFCILGKTSVASYLIADDIKKHGGSQSYTIGLSNYVLTSRVDSLQSSKLKQIVDDNIVILSDTFINDCIKSKQLKDFKLYQLESKSFITQAASSSTSLSKSTDNSTTSSNSAATTTTTTPTIEIDPTTTHISGISIYGDTDKHQPKFSSYYEILSSHLLQCSSFVKNNNVNKFFYLELQKCNLDDGNIKYRIYTQFGRTNELKSSTKQHRYFFDYKECCDVYSSIYNNKTSEENGYKNVLVSHSLIGSPLKLSKNTNTKDNDNASNSLSQYANIVDEDVERVKQRTYVSKEVSDLVSYVFEKSTRSLIGNFSVTFSDKGIETPLGVLSLDQVTKGETILKQIYSLMLDQDQQDDDEENELIGKLSSEFYSVIPTKIGQTQKERARAQFKSLADVDNMMENVQLMKDLATTSERNKSNLVTGTLVDMKYESLGTTIHHCHPSSSDYGIVNRLLQKDLDPSSSSSTSSITLVNVYRLAKEEEEINFREDIGNVKLLYHGTKSENIVGILVRGLLMPQIVLSKGGKRSDFGHLGAGIYFGDNISTSLKFTKGRKKVDRTIVQQRAFLFVAMVALGDISEQFAVQPLIMNPPTGHHSIQGVKSTPSQPSYFTQDEFVIYSTDQQKLLYLLELKY
ncbi:hypothetical protein DFA_05786 [Cavenderia fasciculata]|uniref:Poly [ADP-ribose] polymerase n=1 Tax=Cavenderia fasciculata TaxID=261658 RepID=F4PMK5_CACFS|nr:uncharacterized protein DFA_05786 [Cavenderia fasciculata]EGG23652.1 hypothetical protein DFA_05786 [Cavenderia fasciculata]|eukprot:XP_004361503.1 hypothetical protein DFA_05786 [Cavenderia fasciculata]